MAELAMLPSMARFSLRGAADALAAGCAAFGAPAPGVLRAVAQGERAALWLGPDEVLLLGPAGTKMPEIEHLPHALVDIGARQVGMTLIGQGGDAMLAAGCPLDLQRFGVGACTRTMLGKTQVVLWRTAPLAWHIEVWRSFSAYAVGLLRQAGKDWA